MDHTLTPDRPPAPRPALAGGRVPAVPLDQLTKSFGEVRAVQGLDLTVQSGEGRRDFCVEITARGLEDAFIVLTGDDQSLEGRSR